MADRRLRGHSLGRRQLSLLLDTHVLLWWLAGERISDDATARIADPGTLVVVSAATVWEISIKAALGKIRVDGPIMKHVENSGFEPLAISYRHAEQAGCLPLHHHDPFDRMLVAQARAEGLTLVSRDPAFDLYDVKVLRC